jgi:tryptophan-rich sensory protein
MLGVGLAVGAVLASAVVARRNAPTADNPKVRRQYQRLRKPAFQPPDRTFSIVWPPLFLALAVSAVRVWNAPPSAARSEALGFWGAAQALNALWMALGPRRLAAQLAVALASLAASSAYVWRARRVDGAAAAIVAPYVSWIGFANALTEELWRKNPKPTIH